MQEISVLLKSLHELEFLFAYHKHILTVNKCDCDNFMHNLKEFYRVYLNMKNLSVFLRKEISKMYNENLKLKKQNAKLNDKLSSKRSDRSHNIHDDLGKKFYKLEKFDSLMDVTASNNMNCQPMRRSFSQQNLSQESLLSLKTTTSTLFRTTPATTTIGQTIEETESKLAIRKNIMNNQHHHIGSSSCSSFTSSGYYSNMPNPNIFTAVPNHRTDYENHDFENFEQPRKKSNDYSKRFSSIEIGSNNSDSSSSLLNSSRSCNQNIYKQQHQAKFYQSFDNLSYENSFNISKIPSHVYLNKVHDIFSFHC